MGYRTDAVTGQLDRLIEMAKEREAKYGAENAAREVA
jgi:hypothetical protein